MAYSFATNNVDNVPADMINDLTVSNEELPLEGTASDKYDRLLQVWSDTSLYSNDSGIEYPSFYGGSKVDSNNDMVIYVTSLDENIIDYFENLISLDHVRFSEVTYSVQELFDVQNAINDYVLSGEKRRIDTSAIVGTGISFEKNAVNVYISPSAPEDLTDILLEEFSQGNNFCNLNFMTLDLWLV